MDPSFYVDDNHFSSPFDVGRTQLSRAEYEEYKGVRSKGRGISSIENVVNGCVEPVFVGRPKGGPIGRFFGLVKNLKETFFGKQDKTLPDFDNQQEVLAFILSRTQSPFVRIMFSEYATHNELVEVIKARSINRQYFYEPILGEPVNFEIPDKKYNVINKSDDMYQFFLSDPKVPHDFKKALRELKDGESISVAIHIYTSSRDAMTAREVGGYSKVWGSAEFQEEPYLASQAIREARGGCDVSSLNLTEDEMLAIATQESLNFTEDDMLAIAAQEPLDMAPQAGHYEGGESEEDQSKEVTSPFNTIEVVAEVYSHRSGSFSL